MNNQQQSSALVMALAIIAATMLVSTVIVETLDLFDDAEAKIGERWDDGSVYLKHVVYRIIGTAD